MPPTSVASTLPFTLSPPTPDALDWATALSILRDAGAEINRLGPETSLREALQLIAATAVRLIGSDPRDGATAVIYTYDAATGVFDPESRVSAGDARRRAH